MNKIQKMAMVILAAGESKRMNAIKQLLPWKNTTLLGNAIEQGLQSNVDAVYVVLGANAAKIKAEISKYPIEIIEHENWQQGIGSSIAYAIKYFKQSKLDFNSVLITLADQPFINASYYNLLIAQSLAFKERIIASNIDNTPSVPVIFDAYFFDKLLQLNKDKGAKQLMKSVSEDVFIVNSDINLLDIDTAETYEAIFSSFGKS